MIQKKIIIQKQRFCCASHTINEQQRYADVNVVGLPDDDVETNVRIAGLPDRYRVPTLYRSGRPAYFT